MRFSAACLVVVLVQTIAAGTWSSATTRSAAEWQSTPLAITAEEFDEDGARDLAGAYATANGHGLLVVWLVNPQSLTSCGGIATDPLPGPPIVTAVSVRPELLATGDFDNDGHRDVAVAERGSTSLVVLSGEGTGRFAVERHLDLPGRITALASGDVNLADGLADLAVGVVAGESARLLVFEGPGGALRSVPESVDLASPARRITIGQFDGPGYADLEAVCDGECVVVAGRNRCVLAGPTLVSMPPPEVRVAVESRDVLVGETSLSATLRLNGDAIPDVAELVPGFDRPALKLSSPRGTFVVTSAEDAGPGTLREAITLSNASEGLDEIDFAIGEGAQTILLATPLPDVTDPVFIDGSSQPGFAGAPLVEVSGSSTAASAIRVISGNSTIRGLAFTRFPSVPDLFNDAVRLENGGSNRIEGCVFGTNAVGDDLGNGRGIGISNSSDNTIGGPFEGGRNVFGWNEIGVLVMSGSSGTLIRNNLFGMTADLQLATPNSIGTRIDDAPRNSVGGVFEGEGNVALGGFSYGIDVISNGSAENLIQGNWVGITPDRQTVYGNAEGIGVCGGANNGAKSNLVGGTAAGASNVVVGNGVGVAIGTAPDVDATENRILCNEIHGSSVIGIDLGRDQFSSNDAGDTDAGPNEQQNAPVLETLVISGDTATVTGVLSSRPNEAFRIEFFTGDGRTELGFGDGGVLAGSADVTTDTAGNGGLAVTFPVDVLRGESIVATATDSSGDTSEFSISLAIEVMWQEPDPNAGTNPPPRNPQVRVAGSGGDELARNSSPRSLVGYKVYRGTTPDFEIGPSNFFQSLPATTMLPTFVLGSGAFFRITACYDTGESAPTDAIPGGVAPVVTSLTRRTGKIVARGSGFAGGVVEFANGVPFSVEAKVKAGGAKVVQRGRPIAGDSIDVTLRNYGFVTILIRNASGGTAFGRLTL